MRFLRSNTAVIVTVGPFYDKTDGVTIETALTITNERITLTADTDAGSAPTNILDNVTGATAATANDLNYITGNDAGMMQLELAAADTNRVGRMFLSITDAANHVPVFHEFFVLPQAIYDWLTGVIVPLPANVTTWLGTAAATPTVAGVPEVDLTHVAGSTTNVSTLATDVQAIITDTADMQPKLGTPAGASISADILVIDNFVDGIESTIGAAGAGLTAVADQVWDLDATLHQTQGTFGQAIGDPAADANTIYAAVVTGAAGATVAADIIAVKADTAAILVDTGTTLDGRIPAALVGGRMDASVGAMATDVLTAAAIAADAVTELRSIVSGTADSGTTTTMVDAARTEADTDYWKDMAILFTSGTISGQARLITAFDAATDTITFSPAVTQAVGTNTYEILQNVAAAGASAPTAAEVADAVWDEAQAGHVTAGTFGEIATETAAILVDTGTTLDAALAVVDANVDAILVDTGTTLQAEVDAIQAAVITNAAGVDIAADIIALKAETAAILADTDVIGAAGAGLTALATQTSVNTIDDFLDTEIAAILVDTGTTLDAKITSILSLLDDARAEPGQGAPAVNPDAMTKIDFLYKAWRNKHTQTATEYALYDDAGTTVDQKAAVSDDATTFTRAEVATGP